MHKNVYILENLVFFVAITLVLVLNLYHCSKLVEGIVQQLPYKILQWICVNAVNVIQLSVFSFRVDSPMAYMVLIIFLYIYTTVIFLFFEIRKVSNDKTIFTNQQTAVDDAADVSYVTFKNNEP